MLGNLRKILSLINDTDPQIRKYAISQIELAGDVVDDENLLEIIRKATSDPDSLVSHEASKCLVRLFANSLGSALVPEDEVPKQAFPSGEFDGIARTSLRDAGLCRIREIISALHNIARGANLSLAKRAIISMAKIGAPSSLTVLKETSQIPGLTELSTIAMSQIKGNRVEEAVCDLTKSEAAHIRAIAALSLGALDKETTLDTLLSLVKDDSAVVRAKVATVLGKLDTAPDITGALGRLSRDPEPMVVMAAVNALSLYKQDTAFDLICTACSESSDDRISATCLSALGRRGELKAVQFIRDFLNAPDDRVRANAVEAIGRLQLEPAELRQYLAPLVSDTNNRVVANVIVALHKTEPGKTLQVVRSLLSSDDMWAVASGIWCLGAMRQPEALKLLASVIKNFKDENLIRALRALDCWPADNLPEDIFALLNHGEPMVRERVARFTGKAKGSRITSILLQHFARETDPKVRSAIVFAIGQQASAETFNFLVEALKDNDHRVVADAVEVLGQTQDMQLPAILRPLVSHRNNRVAANACMALWACGELDVADDLLKMFQTSSKDLISAIYAAGEIGRTLRVMDQNTAKTFLAPLKRLAEKLSPDDLFIEESEREELTDYSSAALELEETLLKYLKKGPTEAVSGLTLPEVDNPFYSEITFLAYRLRAELGDDTEAFRLLESISVSSDLYINPVLELAHCYSRLKLEDKAVVSFMEAYRRHQAVLSELLEAGAQAVANEKLSDATHICKFIMTNPAMGTDSHLLVAREFIGAGDVKRAFTHMNRAHINVPADTSVSLEYAQIALAAGYYKIASLVCDEIYELAAADKCPATVLERAKIIKSKLP